MGIWVIEGNSNLRHTIKEAVAFLAFALCSSTLDPNSVSAVSVVVVERKTTPFAPVVFLPCCRGVLQALDVMQVAAGGQGGQAAPQVDLVISADTVGRPGLQCHTWQQGSAAHPRTHRIKAST